MPPKRKVKPSRAKGNPPTKARPGMEFIASATVVGRNEPFKCAQTTSGLGCISNNNTGPSLTAGTNVLVDPFTIGSRAALLAAEFCQYKVNSMTIQYVPDCTYSGVVNTQGGPTTTPSYGSRPFAMSWSGDPGIIATTHSGIMEQGGVSTNTARSATIRVPSSGWKYTSSSAAYSLANVNDNRFTSHGIFSAAFVDASTTAAATYGRFVWSYNLSFRYPANVSVIGDMDLGPDSKDKPEEKKSDFHVIALKGTSQPPGKGGWFGT